MMKNRKIILIKTILPMMMAFLAVACFVCGCLLIRDLFFSAKEKEKNLAIAEHVENMWNEENISELVQGNRIPEDILKPYQKLWEENNDLTGWLAIEGTEIHYPVMHTPNDPQYYIRRGFDKQTAVSGSLFLKGTCDQQSSNLIVYGHNMKDGSMLGTLSLYEDIHYRKTHPVIRFDSLTEVREYEVIAAFYTVLSEGNTSLENSSEFRYYEYENFSDQTSLDEFLNEIDRVNLYKTQSEATLEDRFLTLSTCSYQTDNERFVVIAKRK